MHEDRRRFEDDEVAIRERRDAPGRIELQVLRGPLMTRVRIDEDELVRGARLLEHHMWREVRPPGRVEEAELRRRRRAGASCVCTGPLWWIAGRERLVDRFVD